MSASTTARTRPLPEALGSAAPRGVPVEIMTPEGVPLVLRIGTAGDRASAFMLDLLFLALIMLGVLLIGFWALTSRSGWGTAVFTIVFFVVRTFYFTWFEIRGHGSTPGKRRVGLRVVDAHGGPLTAEAVIARNLTREVEIFLPLVAVIAPKAMGLGGPGWLQLLALLWAFVFLLFPLFNRRRMRAGDLIAGTLVVLEPKTALLGDVGWARRAGEVAGVAQFAFTDKQLDVYGNYELQVLEDVLRRARSTGADPKTLGAVAQKIRKKIGWTGEDRKSVV